MPREQWALRPTPGIRPALLQLPRTGGGTLPKAGPALVPLPHGQKKPPALELVCRHQLQWGGPVFNDTASANAIPQKTPGSRPVVADTLAHSPTFSAPDEDKLALVATLAPYPRSERILKQLELHAEGLGYQVFFRVAVADGDGEMFYPRGGRRESPRHGYDIHGRYPRARNGVGTGCCLAAADNVVQIGGRRFGRATSRPCCGCLAGGEYPGRDHRLRGPAAS